MSSISLIVQQIGSGDSSAASELLPLVYEELRSLARSKLSQEKPDHTLQATALVHEAYIRLIDQQKIPHWNSRGHFFGAAAEAMRRILVEHARHKLSLKAGGELKRVKLFEVGVSLRMAPEDLLALDEALKKLAMDDSECAEIARLRLFAGVTLEEAALAIGTTRTSAFRRWTYARAFLQFELRPEK